MLAMGLIYCVLLVHVNIYLDVSESMRGYVSHSSTFSKLIFHLREFILESNLSSPKIYFLSSTLQRTSMPPEEIAFDRGVFSGASTNLVKFLERCQEMPNDIHMLISDWVLSFPHKGHVTGYNLYEIKEELRKVMTKGLDLTMIGIKSTFDGYIFSETYRLYRTGKPKFKWKGKRPFYVIICAPSTKATSLISQIQDFLEEEQDSYRLLHLPPALLQPTIDLTSLQVLPPEGRANFILTNVPEPDSVIFFEYALQSKLRPGRTVYVEIPIFLQSPDEKVEQLLNEYSIDLRFTFHTDPPSLSYPGFQLGYNNGVLTMQYDRRFTEYIAQGETAQFNVTLTLENAKASDVWADWSTDNDALETTADKTLYLSETLAFLLKTYSLVYTHPLTLKFRFYR